MVVYIVVDSNNNIVGFDSKKNNHNIDIELDFQDFEYFKKNYAYAKFINNNIV